VLRSSDVWLAADRAKLELAEPTIAIIAVLPPAANRLRLDIFMAFSKFSPARHAEGIQSFPSKWDRSRRVSKVVQGDRTAESSSG
jgi:hypothetical protein